MKIITVVGARPNFMKAGPIIAAVNKHNERTTAETIQHVLVHTGQHYDADMSAVFFNELELPEPTINLGIQASREMGGRGIMAPSSSIRHGRGPSR